MQNDTAHKLTQTFPVDNSADNLLRVHGTHLITGYSPEIHRLLTGLFTNHPLLFLGWAFWRVGSRQQAFEGLDGLPCGAAQKREALTKLCAYLHQLGRRGVPWHDVLLITRLAGPAPDPERPTQVLPVPRPRAPQKTGASSRGGARPGAGRPRKQQHTPQT